MLGFAGICRRAEVTCFRYTASQRSICSAQSLCSGHNRWSKIGREKAKVDSAKSKQISIYSYQIARASKHHGPDPKANSQLADLIANAKRTGMPKASIDAAILRGLGKSSTGAALEGVIIEAVIPPVALILEAQTDKKGQMLQEVRQMLKMSGGAATPTTYLFERRGRITLEPMDNINSNDVLAVALDIGALDVEDGADGRIVVDTDPTALKSVEAALIESLGAQVELSETLWVPNADTIVRELSDDSLEEIEKLTNNLEQYPGVEGVFTNLSLS